MTDGRGTTGDHGPTNKACKCYNGELTILEESINMDRNMWRSTIFNTGESKAEWWLRSLHLIYKLQNFAQNNFKHLSQYFMKIIHYAFLVPKVVRSKRYTVISNVLVKLSQTEYFRSTFRFKEQLEDWLPLEIVIVVRRNFYSSIPCLFRKRKEAETKTKA